MHEIETNVNDSKDNALTLAKILDYLHTKSSRIM